MTKPSSTRKRFGIALSDHLTSVGWRLTSLAQAMPCSAVRLQDICAGGKLPTRKQLERIGKAFPAFANTEPFRAMERELSGEWAVKQLKKPLVRASATAEAVKEHVAETGGPPDIDALHAFAAKQFGMPVESLKALLRLQSFLGNEEFRDKLNAVLIACDELHIELRDALKLF